MPKEQQIAKGVFMTKRKKKVKDQLYYIMEIRLTLFKNLNFNINLNGSSNVEIVGTEGLEKQIIVPFQTTTEVAKIKLNKGWSLKTKFKFTYTLPTFEEQQQHLRKYEYQKDSSIQQSIFLENFEFKDAGENQISQFLDKRNQKFIDHEFLPNKHSLGFGDQKQQFDRFQCIIHWRRIEEFHNNEEEDDTEENIFEYVYPHNVILGLMNNHWFLSAIMCIAENPKLIRRLFKTKFYNKKNFYRLKIGQLGSWQQTILDDFIPCYPLDQPIFGATDNEDLWVLLIEKCYAKLYDSYKCIEKGDFKNALVDLTCAPLLSYEIDQSSEQNQNQIKNIIQEALLKNWISALQVRRVQQLQDFQDSEIFDYGFYISRLENHEGDDIVEIKNNWNLFEWNGMWGQEDTEKWTDNAIEQLQPDFENQDTFWMNFNDLQKNFSIIHVLKTQVWNELRQKGKFIKAVEIMDENTTHFCSRWAYPIKVQQTSKINIGIHQEDENIAGVKEHRPYLDIGIAIITFQEGVYRLLKVVESDTQRQVFLDIELQPGDYIVIPYSSGLNMINFNKEPKDIDLQDQQFLSLLEDTFLKLDLKSKNFLDAQNMKNFCEKINIEFDEDEFEELCEYYNIQDQSLDQSKGIVLKKFKDFLLQIFHKSSEEEQYELLLKMGYEKSFFSSQSRVFVLSIHSSSQILLGTQDALVKKYDYLLQNLIAKKKGKDIYNKDNIKLYQFHNMFFKNLINHSDKKFEVDLNLAQNKNLILTSGEQKIKKKIDKQTSLFITHVKFVDENKNEPEVIIDIKEINQQLQLRCLLLLSAFINLWDNSIYFQTSINYPLELQTGFIFSKNIGFYSERFFQYFKTLLQFEFFIYNKGFKFLVFQYQQLGNYT